MNPTRRHNLNSIFADQRERGFRRLLFDNFVEQEFRQYYSQSSVARARLVLGLAVAAVVFTLGAHFAHTVGGDVHIVSLAFYGLFMLPTFLATWYVSTLPDRHRLYQLLLALSVLEIGVIVCSYVSRASMAGNTYYFGVLISWIFVDWLVLGLLFRHAARTAILVSGMYIFGLFHWNFDTNETIFSIVLLTFGNLVGAFCCYQLEYAVRRSFLESKVLAQLAERDGLTGLYNRRSYDHYIERIWRQSRREQTQLTILFIDIDDFKAFNDYYGHQAGDDALKKVAEVIAASAQRPLDFTARYGGEEFALVLYGPASGYGRELPEQLRQDIMELKIRHERGSTGQYLTASIGVAIVMPDAERSMAGAIQMADEALYQAKENGRNCVVVKESLNTQIQTGRFRASRKVSA